jgi:hypothetical protein
MSQNVKLIDGGVDQGSRLLTIAVGSSNASTVSTNYATDDFTWDADSNFQDRSDENNVANGSVGIVSPRTGTAPLQLAALTTPEPSRFNRFNEDLNETKSGITTIPIAFRVALTTSVTVLDSDGVTTTMGSVLVP